MVKQFLGTGFLVMALVACGSETKAPNLSAPPTRTPAPTGQAMAVAVVPDAIEVISADGSITDFLARSTEISPIDQAATLIESMGQGCLSQDQFELFFGLAWVRFPMDDFSAWQTSARNFPAADLEQGIKTAAAGLTELLPADGSPLQICLIPVPHIDPPLDVPQDAPTYALRNIPHMAALDDLNIVALDGHHLLALCSGSHLDDLPMQVIRALSLAYQLRLSGRSLNELSLRERLVYEGRADAFLRESDPDVIFAWDGALTPKAEEDFWRRYHMSLDDIRPNYESINVALYGLYSNTGTAPMWGGLYVADQIVRAYLAQFPDTSWTDLAAISPQALVEESAYGPALAVAD